jgi:hypothetical protein
VVVARPEGSRDTSEPPSKSDGEGMRIGTRGALLATSLALSAIMMAGASATGQPRAGTGPDPRSSAVQCGAGGHPCPAPDHGKATCSAGRCGFVCDPGFAQCGDRCVSLQTDALNCGACGHECPGEDAPPSSYCDQSPQRACITGQCKKCRWYCGGYGGYYRVCT